jgi:hypothetical protein
MFASRNIARHLLRGLAGFGLLATSLHVLEAHPGWSLVLLALGVVVLRGCPTCWTLGLIETAIARWRGEPSTGCVDGSCATARPREP